jgi:hypothetical protein
MPPRASRGAGDGGRHAPLNEFFLKKWWTH